MPDQSAYRTRAHDQSVYSLCLTSVSAAVFSEPKAVLLHGLEEGLEGHLLHLAARGLEARGLAARGQGSSLASGP